MAIEVIRRRLRDDEFALYFSGGTGIAADSLGQFLQRISAVTRRDGVEIQVLALEAGSLAVVMRALRYSAGAVAKEFANAPIQTTGAATALVVVAVNSIAWAMSPQHSQPKPAAKVGAEIVEQGQAQRIDIITGEKTTLLMDPERAYYIGKNASLKKSSRLISVNEVRRIVELAREGALSGVVVGLEHELYFRPDGYQYLVPMKIGAGATTHKLVPGMHLTVKADLRTFKGQPDILVIHEVSSIW